MSFVIKIKDEDTQNEASARVEFFGDNEENMVKAAMRATADLLKSVGVCGKEVEVKGLEACMSDLDHKPEEGDTIQKAENPDADYMKSNNLCQKCHAPVDKCTCGDG